jgi:hypothetical protein
LRCAARKNSDQSEYKGPAIFKWRSNTSEDAIACARKGGECGLLLASFLRRPVSLQFGRHLLPKTLQTKSVIDELIRRGIAPDRIERTIKDVEVAADVMTNKAKSRIAHRKRAKLKVVKS